MSVNAAQVEHANILLSPWPGRQQSLQALVLCSLQLFAAGCSPTVACRHVLMRPRDMLIKCVQYACHHDMSAAALWDAMYGETKAHSGGTGLHGIVHIVLKAMPQLSVHDAIRASALLLLQNECGTDQREVGMPG
jgi:hypothetical protein